MSSEEEEGGGGGSSMFIITDDLDHRTEVSLCPFALYKPNELDFCFVFRKKPLLIQVGALTLCPCFRTRPLVTHCLSNGVCFKVCEHSGFLIKQPSVRK